MYIYVTFGTVLKKYFILNCLECICKVVNGRNAMACIHE